MNLWLPQNPGIGGLDELTPAEEAFITSFVGLSHTDGDIYYYNSGQIQRLPIGSNGQVLTISSGLPEWGSSGVTDHGDLSGLSDDDHTQYALLAGRSGGQTLYGGTASGNDLILNSTSDSTKGTIFLDVASAPTLTLQSGGTIDPYFYTGTTSLPYLYLDRTTGDTHIGWEAEYTVGGFDYRDSNKFYFDTEFEQGGIRPTYIYSAPVNAGIQQQFRLRFVVDGTEVFGLSSVEGAVASSATLGSWLISSNIIRTTNTAAGFIRGEFNYIQLQGELNTGGGYDIRVVGKNPFGGATASNILGIFSDTTIQSYFKPNGGLVLNEQGADEDTRFEGDTDANLFYLDAGNDRIGIGTATPGYKFDVSGDINTSGVYRVGGTAGVSGSFTTVDGKTVTVTSGIITSIV